MMSNYLQCNALIKICVDGDESPQIIHFKWKLLSSAFKEEQYKQYI